MLPYLTMDKHLGRIIFKDGDPGNVHFYAGECPRLGCGQVITLTQTQIKEFNKNAILKLKMPKGTTFGAKIKYLFVRFSRLRITITDKAIES